MRGGWLFAILVNAAWIGLAVYLFFEVGGLWAGIGGAMVTVVGIFIAIVSFIMLTVPPVSIDDVEL